MQIPKQILDRARWHTRKVDLYDTASRLYRAAKTRSERKNIECTIDVDFVISKLKVRKCEATGLKIELTNNRNSQFRPSLDRRDNAKGYTKENTQLVCVHYNLAKGIWTTKQLFELARVIVENSSLKGLDQTPLQQMELFDVLASEYP